MGFGRQSESVSDIIAKEQTTLPGGECPVAIASGFLRVEKLFPRFLVLSVQLIQKGKNLPKPQSF